jgi:histidyl-tRNA synthetase
MLKRIKGTCDMLDLRLYNFIVAQAREHLNAYHFHEITTPLIENTELFKRSLGLETDVVSKEMFIIQTRGEDKESMCLRPEMTASVVRAFVENGVQQTPWKVFSVGPVFRYERPQKGRFRQFHQLNIEVIGSASIAQDVQLIKMVDRFFHEKLKLTNTTCLLNFLGCFNDRAEYRVMLAQFLDGVIGDLCELCTTRKDTNIMRIFDCKNPSCQKLYEDAPRMTDCLCAGCAAEWQTLQDQLSLLSVSFVQQPKLVRGLDYYNKTVFEFVSEHLGAQSSVCGGGRYDQLVSQIGGTQDQPSVGVGIGMERLMLLLEHNIDVLPVPQPPALHLILPMETAQKTLALLMADELQSKGLCVDVLVDGDSMKSMMRKANKLGAKYCLILGSQEQADRTVTVKNMVTGDSVVVPQVNVVEYLKP